MSAEAVQAMSIAFKKTLIERALGAELSHHVSYSPGAAKPDDVYARGIIVREVQGFLAEKYGVEASPEFISSVTNDVMGEVTAWQARPLEPMYPVVFFDALRVKIREDAVVRNKAIDLLVGRFA